VCLEEAVALQVITDLASIHRLRCCPAVVGRWLTTSTWLDSRAPPSYLGGRCPWQSLEVDEFRAPGVGGEPAWRGVLNSRIVIGCRCTDVQGCPNLGVRQSEHDGRALNLIIINGIESSPGGGSDREVTGEDEPTG
jgi:hypothetical protein